PAGGQLDLRPLQIAQLGCPQAVAIADQDHSRVPMAVAAGLPGGRHQALDLGRGPVLAGANWGIYRGWCRPAARAFSQDILHAFRANWRIIKCFLSSVNRSSWSPWPTLARSEPTHMASASQP